MDSEDPIITPTTLAIAGLATSLVGAGLSAYGQYRQGEAQQEAYNANAKVAEENAKAAKESSAWEEQQSRLRLTRLMGTQRTLYAKAGVDLSSGSPLMVLADTAAKGAEEVQAIRYGGDVAATQQLNQARLDRMYGKNAYNAGMIGAGSTFLTGLGQAGTQYAMMKSGAKTTPTNKRVG